MSDHRTIWPLAYLLCGWLALARCGTASEEAEAPPSALAPTQGAAAKLALEELITKIKDAVVVVTFEGRDGERQGLGSGFVIDPKGLIATNLHVIGEARPIRVTFANGKTLDVSAIHATSKSQDLAILRVDADNLPALKLGNSDDLQQGQSVIALGNPVGLQWSVVTGVLSGRREIDGREMLQIAMPIERGNSGGPLVDLEGRVHGLVTLKSLQTNNLGFAVTVNALKPLLEHPNPVPMSRWLTIGVLDPADWLVQPGPRWRQRAGRILVDGEGRGLGSRALCLSQHNPPAIPFEVAVSVKFTPDEGAAGLVVQSDGRDRHYGFYLSNGQLRFSRFDGPDVYSWQVLSEVNPGNLLRTDWNDLKIRVEADRMVCFLNDREVIQSTDRTYTTGLAGLCKFRQTVAEFRDFEVGTSLPSRQPDRLIMDRVDELVRNLRNEPDWPAEVMKELAAGVPESPELLELAAKELEQRAERIRGLATEIHVRQTQRKLSEELAQADEDIDLLRAALLIARIDNREVDVDAYVNQTNRLAERIRQRAGRDAAETERLAALDKELFEELGFHGSRTDYNNRSNSYLNEVLEDREGLPITLSIVYIELARRLDLPVTGVGLPGHFIVRFDPKKGERELIDVFERGARMSQAEAMARVAALEDVDWNDAYLEPQTSQGIIIRMLRNLFSLARDEGDRAAMLRYTDTVLAILPDSEQDRFFRAVLCYQMGRLAEARTDVNWLLEQSDEEISREAVMDLDRALSREERRFAK